MKVLVVAAHPDDAEISMGMRIRWYADNGASVRVHCLSRGSADPIAAEQRTEEALRAGSLLGVKEYTFSDVADTRFNEHRSAINELLFPLLRADRPDVVYTHYPTDQHADHSVAGVEVTVVARREAANLTYFRSPYSVGFEPNLFFVGSTDLLEAKMRALHCFSSQSQFDVQVFRQLAEVAYRQHIHHRVVERFDPDLRNAESFRSERRIEFGTPQAM